MQYLIHIEAILSNKFTTLKMTHKKLERNEKFTNGFLKDKYLKIKNSKKLFKHQ